MVTNEKEHALLKPTVIKIISTPAIAQQYLEHQYHRSWYADGSLFCDVCFGLAGISPVTVLRMIDPLL